MEYTGVYCVLYSRNPTRVNCHIPIFFVSKCIKKTDNITLTSDLRVAMGADGSAIPTFQKKVITRIIS